jgi:hypothetical protein
MRYATSRTVPGSIPSGVTGIFSDVPSDRTMALGSTQWTWVPGTFLGVKAAGAWGWQSHHLHVPNVMKIWEPKPPGTLWDAPGLLRDDYTFYIYYNQCRLLHVSDAYCDHDGGLKRVENYTDYDIINIHISICTCWLFLIRNQCMVRNNLKYRRIYKVWISPSFYFLNSFFFYPAFLVLLPRFSFPNFFWLSLSKFHTFLFSNQFPF